MFNAKPRPVLASKHGLWNINIVKRFSISHSNKPFSLSQYSSPDPQSFLAFSLQFQEHTN